jgi:hypothetical protein
MTLALIKNYLDKDNFTETRTDRKPRANNCLSRRTRAMSDVTEVVLCTPCRLWLEC